MWQMLNLIENLEILGVLSLPNFKSFYEWSSEILELQESHKFASELLSANQICNRLKTVFEADKPMLSKLHKCLIFEALELTSFEATMLILQNRTSKAARRIKVSNLQKLRGVKTMKGGHMNFRNLYNKGFTYHCSWCRFNLHPKCASKQDHQELLQQQTFEKLTLYHFYHKQHALNFCNLRYSNKKYCCCCKKIISGSAYCCLECGFFIHESCKEIPVEVQHPFHPQHILLTQAVDVQNKLISGRYRNKICCNACKSSIRGIKIGCNKCAFQLHVSCANPSRYACFVKTNSHQHNMNYFVDDYTTGSFECNKCHEKCLEESFYRCVECDFNLHLKCVPIPSVVMITQKHHHPLTLIDSVKEDNPLIQYLVDSNDKVDSLTDYYCDDCETPGNPKHHAYCCKECNYIAHVDCIISKGDTSLEIQSNLNPTDGTEPKEEQKNTSDKGKFHPAELECSTTELQAAQSQTMSKSDTSLEILSDLNPTHGTEPKKEQKNTSDEGEFHPAELECSTTELQAAQTLSKINTSLEIPSNLNPTDGTEPKKEPKNTSDEGEFHPAKLEFSNTELQAAQTMSKSDTSLKIASNLNPIDGTEPKKEQKNMSDEGEFHPAKLELLQAAQTMSKSDTSLEIQSNFNPKDGTVPKKEQKNMSDEGEFHPGELECSTTELQVAQTLSKVGINLLHI
ncbi:hypothetical protein LWI28_016498 [Acer negundo]|uniref:Phorbol-ester/DAG-type domain-containing protein n=1 Tax=Acer negundo TaxID=4023 RepID=A0AAD5J5W5_ACENE|nr:hypothetical protein LWI28_016498 [Acer negundo]